MTPPLLRRLWQMIEELPQHSLENLDDLGLVTWVLSHLERHQHLRIEERKAVERYLNTHMMLIRDVSDSLMA